MNILLINTNPVVSRLLVLCTRDDAITLNEVSTIEEVEGDSYGIVLVDEASFGQDVADVLTRLGNAKKVFISYDNNTIPGFDMTIKKPFLPSQILELIKNVVLSVEDEEEMEDEERTEESDTLDAQPEEVVIHSIFPLSDDEDTLEENTMEGKDTSIQDEESEVPIVLDGSEIERIKALLDMDEQIETLDEILSDDALEVRKREVIKEQLIADGLEIVLEETIVGDLSIDLDGTLYERKDSGNTKSNKKSKKLKLTKKKMQKIEDAVKSAMSNMTKKEMKKLLKGKEIEINVKLEGNN